MGQSVAKFEICVLCASIQKKILISFFFSCLSTLKYNYLIEFICRVYTNENNRSIACTPITSLRLFFSFVVEQKRDINNKNIVQHGLDELNEEKYQKVNYNGCRSCSSRSFMSSLRLALNSVSKRSIVMFMNVLA